MTLDNKIIQKIEGAMRAQNPKIFIDAPALKLFKNVSNPGIKLSGVNQALAKVPELSDQILLTANTVFAFDAPKIEQALQKLGVEGLFRMFAVYKFKHMYNFADDQAWINLLDHSLGTAICAEQIALQCAPEEAENLFLAGLMHDIGKILLINFLPGEYAKVRAKNESDPNKRLVLNEKEVLGTDHQEVGSYFLSRLFFPQMYLDVTGNHHYVTRDTPSRKQAAIILTANNMAKALEFGASENFYVEPIPKWIWNMLQVREYHFAPLFKAMQERWKELRLLLDKLK